MDFDEQAADDYFRSQGLVLNAEGTEWVKPATPIPDWVETPDSSPADIAAYRVARGVKHSNPLPVQDDRGSPFSGPADPARPSYIMEPDLQEAQGGMHLPPGLMQEDSGRFYYQDDPAKTVPMVRRPGLVPLANTPEGYKFVMPKLLDLVGNVMGNVAAPRVAAKAGEMVLGSGMVKKMPEWDIKGFEGQNWYHGTTHDFEKFSKAKGNPENHLGQYPHFTNNAEDAGINYAGLGPDLTGRIERRAEDILQNTYAKANDGIEYGTPEYKLAYDKAIEQATKELKGHEGAIIPTKMKLQNPVSLIESKPTWIDFNGERKINKLANVFKKLGEKYSFDGQKVFGEVADAASIWDGDVKASTLNKAMREAESLMYVDNDKGNLISSHIISDVFKSLGFDGIVMDAKQAFPNMKNIPEGTLHAVPLKQNTVKGAYNDKILFSDTRNQVAAQVGHQIEKNGFYSQLERSVKDAKINLATPEQWLGYLRNQPGVKSEELNHVLGDLPREGMLSKGQLEDVVKANKVELKEKYLGDNKQTIAKLNELQPSLNKMLQENDNLGFSSVTEARKAIITNDPKAWEFNKPEDLALAEQYSSIAKSSEKPTQYHQYQLPGGENYKEMLLSLPERGERQVMSFEQYSKDHRRADGSIDPNIEAALRPMYEGYKKDRSKVPSEENFKAPHFGDDGTNLLAHIRMNDRYLPTQVSDRFDLLHNKRPLSDAEHSEYMGLLQNPERSGKKSLHLEEVQSDWHQAGRKRGYKITPEQNKKLDEMDERIIKGLPESVIGDPEMDNVLKAAVEKKLITSEEAKNYKEWSKGAHSNIPDAPFKKTWDELALKRMIHKAASEGYEAISWTPGEAQALRYQNEIRQKLKTIDWEPRAKHLEKFHDDNAKGPGITHIGIEGESGNIWLNTDKEGNIVSASNKELVGETLDKAIGKDIARQILEKPKGNIDAKGYVMGAEGMKSFYDKMLVDKANAIAKKYGSKVEQREINKTENKNHRIEEHNPEGQTLLRTQRLKDQYPYAIFFDNPQGEKRFLAAYENKAVADEALAKIKADKQPIHYLPITKELRQKAKEGFPLFSSSPTIIPIDHDPFEKDKKKIKLIPVQGNPFER